MTESGREASIAGNERATGERSGVSAARVAVYALFIGGLIALAVPSSAWAQGGTTVETAPLIASGQTVSGNTSSDSVIAFDLQSDPVCMSDEELWKVNLNAGEELLLKGSEQSAAAGFDVEAFPPGVTDAQLFGSSDIAGVQSSTLDQGLSFYAPLTGAWLIAVGPDCYSGSDGPYQLTATVYAAPFPPGSGGGNTIETAPLIASGQTVSGNSAADNVVAFDLQSDPACMSDEELWKVNLNAGEEVLLKGREELPGAGFDVEAFPPGVTDGQLFGSNPIAGVQSSSLDQGLSFYAPLTGTWLIAVGPDCYDGSDGPYQLSATVYAAPFPPGSGGGNSIETAPLIASGQTVSGNTAADKVIAFDLQSDPACMNDEELWTVNVQAGDEVLLKGREELPASGFDVEAFPPGTNDAQLFGSSDIVGVQSSTLDQGLSFRAAKSGAWVLAVGPDCYDGNDGPYQLSATIYAPGQGKVKIISHAVKRRMATLVVQIPSAGRVVGSGRGVSTAVKQPRRAGRLSLKLPLSASGVRALRARHVLKVRINVAFKPKQGSRSSASTTVTFRQRA